MKFDDSLLERNLTLQTRHENPEAGEEPVEFATPVVTENHLVIPSETVGIELKERATLNTKWILKIKNGVSSQVLLDGDTLFFGANDGFFYAVDLEVGKILWKLETKAPVFSRATASKGMVLINSSDDIVYALDRNDGKWVWQYKRPHNGAATTIRGNSSPLVLEDKVLAGFSDGYFLSLNLKDGNLLWETKIHKGIKFTDVDAEPTIDGKKLYVPSYDGGLYCLDPSNGKVLWFTDVGGSKQAVIDDSSAQGSKMLYLPSSDGRIFALNKETGAVLWTFELDLGTPTELLIHQNQIVFGSSRQYLYVISKTDGRLLYRYNAGLRSGFFGRPVFAMEDKGSNKAKEFFIYSNFGNLYSFRWSRSR